MEQILSERLVYCPIKMEDLDTYVKFNNEKSYRQWFYFQEPLNRETARRAIEIMNNQNCYTVNILQKSFDMGLYLKGTEEFIGTVSLNKFHGPEEELDYVEVGYGIGEAYQNKGYATEATKAAVTWGLKRLAELGAEPVIHGNVEHENYPSRRVLEKTGFQLIRTEEYLSIYELKGTFR